MRIATIIQGWRAWLRRQRISAVEALAVLRLTECKTCPFLKAGICTQCGCVVKAKARVLAEQCPENRWIPEIQSYGAHTFIVAEDLPAELQLKFSQSGHPYIADRELPPNELIALDTWEMFSNEQ